MLSDYNLFYFLFYIICYSHVMSAPISYNASDEQMEECNILHQKENHTSDMMRKELNEIENEVYNGLNKAQSNISRGRVKRQASSGAGKFMDAAKMPQIKLLRLVLQLFKNAWDSAYVGGAHPLHHNVPKAIVALYKQKIVEFFIPDVGNEKV